MDARDARRGVESTRDEHCSKHRICKHRICKHRVYKHRVYKHWIDHRLHHGDPVKAKLPSLDAYSAAAWMLRCEVAGIRAVAEVEASRIGGFLDTGEPTLLFERHLFHRLTGGRWSASHPDVSYPRAGGYGAVGDQHRRLRRAVDLDREAALMSASWGLFQILGLNFARAGHPGLQSFINAMYAGVGDHLRAFVYFLHSDPRLEAALRVRDWATFAALYNGPDYARHDYHGRLAAAYRRLAVVTA